MRRAALEQNLRLETRNAARGVEESSDREIAGDLQQRPGREFCDLDAPGATEPRSRMACGQHVRRQQRIDLKVLRFRRERAGDDLSQMDVAPRESPEDFLRADDIVQLHVDAGVTLRVDLQESGENALDQMRRRGDLQYADVASTLQTAKIQERLAAMGVEPMTMTPSQFASFVQQEIESNATLVRTLGLKPE